MLPRKRVPLQIPDTAHADFDQLRQHGERRLRDGYARIGGGCVFEGWGDVHLRINIIVQFMRQERNKNISRAEKL